MLQSKRHRVAEWIRKHVLHICCLQETHLRTTATQTESEWLEKNIPSKWTGKKSWGTNIISDKIDFRTKSIKRDTEGHFKVVKGRIHQEGINIVNIYASNTRAPKYISKILEDFKKDVDSNTLIRGDFKNSVNKG